MQIAVASGKGGTGKTTVATNLAWTIASLGENVTYADCDVEAPNGHIFLKPDIKSTNSATVLYPVVNEEKCISCGKCAEICQYKAIILLEKTTLVFPEMCHACGGCSFVCPADAITEDNREIGLLETGSSGGVEFVHGKLNIGQIMSPPLIRQVKDLIPNDGVTIIDCPPGTSCPVIESIRGADYVLLVTEPTPFGLSDLKLAVEVVRKLKMPYGVFINRSDSGNQETIKFCEKECVPVISSIPNDRRIAEAYSKGVMVSEVFPEIREIFSSLYTDLKKRV